MGCLTITSHFSLRLLVIVIGLLPAPYLDAQLCTGSLGDPAVNITFGPGNNSTNYTPPNAYIYTTSSCPNDGYYTITNSTSGCFGNSWHTVNSDHTGNGAFMLVNASYEPGDFFLTTVTDLCPNTSYEFAAWLMNVLVRFGIRPNITFSIETTDGTVLGTYSTGDIPETSQPTWQQYGFYFTTPATNPDIVLRMTNNAPGGNGNDIALDDITFRPCGPIITAAIQGNKDTVDVCEGNTDLYTFTAAASSNYLDPVYHWQVSTDTGVSWHDIAGANTLSYLRMPTGAGAYWYRLTVIERNFENLVSCRIASNKVVINIHANPYVSAGPDRVLIAGVPVTLGGIVTGEGPQFYWTPPDHLDNNILLTPVASPVDNTVYTLSATSAYGCKNKDDMLLKVVAGIFVPNAFTPNGDGKNDNWRIPFLDPLLRATVTVYNRAGQVMYHADETTVDWDGTVNGLPQPAGTYVYNITFKTGYPSMKGTVIIIR